MKRVAMMAEKRGGNPQLRSFDDETLLDMYEDARASEDETCDAIAAELNWRGIEVHPCGHPHGLS